MCGVGVSSTINAWKGLQIGTISESYAPSENIYGAIATDSNVSVIKVTANGSIEVNSKSSTIYSGHNIEGQVAYLLDQYSISQYGTTSFSSQQLSVWKNMNMCTVDVPIGKTLPNNTYTVVPVIQRNGVPFTCSVVSKTTTSFKLYVWTMGDFGAESFTVNWHISYQYSISPIKSKFTLKVFTTTFTSVKYDLCIERSVSIGLNGYTPLGIVGVWTNHNGSLVLTEFRVTSETTAYIAALCQTPGGGTWSSVDFKFTVLYVKNS